MNKKILLLIVLSIICLGLMAQRVYTQKVIAADPNVDIYNIVTNTSSTTSPLYIIEADILETPGEVLTTEPGNPDGHLSMPVGTIRINRLASIVVTILQLASFPTPFQVGQTVQMKVIERATGDFTTWQIVIPAGGAAITIFDPVQLVPPFPVIPTTHIISGSITSQWDLTGVTISATDIDPANITYDAGAYTVTVPDGWSGTITPSKTDYIFEPASYTYTDVVADIPDQNFVMKTVVVPGLPTNLAPNDITLTFTEPTAVTLTWEAPVGVNVDSYKLIWNNGPELNLGNVLTYTTDPLGAGTYTWKVCAVNNTATKTYTPVRVQINGRSTAGTNNPKADGAWAEASFIVEIVTFDFPEGTPIVPPGASVTVTITITGGSANNGTGTIPPFVNPSFVPAEQYIFDLVGAGPWTLTFNTTALWAAYYLNGIWTAVQNIGGTITIVINPTKDISGVPVVLGDVDPTLPVELSYFAATLTAENYVNIAWRTESSTDMLGYRIYRSMTENQSEAINITPVMIDAINTSNTQNYSHIDREVENGNTYYYWLEAVDYSHNSIFYETSPVYVDGPTTPELPNITTMRNAYPNPFRAGSGTTIEVDVKAGDNGTVTIYNILGQVVKTFPVNEGTNNLTWNARDSKGTLCGNGIYFYKLSTKTINQTKKMVIIK